MLYKYDVVILAVFKNEESFLPEWLDHYLKDDRLSQQNKLFLKDRAKPDDT